MLFTFPALTPPPTASILMFAPHVSLFSACCGPVVLADFFVRNGAHDGESVVYRELDELHGTVRANPRQVNYGLPFGPRFRLVINLTI